jgi:hypothetical protein
MEWQIHNVVATYLASHVDKVIINCFYELHVNVVSPIYITKLVVLFLSSISLTQLLSL